MAKIPLQTIKIMVKYEREVIIMENKKYAVLHYITADVVKRVRKK